MSTISKSWCIWILRLFVNEECLAIQYQKNCSNQINPTPSIFTRNYNEKPVSFLTGGYQDPFTEAFCTNKGFLSALFVHLEWLVFIINNINLPLNERPDSLLLPSILQPAEGWRITDIRMNNIISPLNHLLCS